MNTQTRTRVCAHCGSEQQSENMMCCPSCGSSVCCECGEQDGGICPDCYGAMQYVQ